MILRITFVTTRTTRLKVNFQNVEYNCPNNQAKLLCIFRAKFFKVSSILDKTFELLHASAWFPCTTSETARDYYQGRVNDRVASRFAERFK